MVSSGDAASVDPDRCRRLGGRATSESVGVVVDASSPSRASRYHAIPGRPDRPTVRRAAGWPAGRSRLTYRSYQPADAVRSQVRRGGGPSAHEAPVCRGPPAARGCAPGAAGGARGIPRSRRAPDPMRTIHVRPRPGGFTIAQVVRVRASSGFARHRLAVGGCASAGSASGGARSDGRWWLAAEACRRCGSGRSGPAGRRERATACVGDARACERL